MSLAANGDRAGICSFFGRNDALDTDGLLELIAGIKVVLCELLAMKGGERPLLSRQDAVRLLHLCERVEEYARMNVGVKHIMGMLCVLTV